MALRILACFVLLAALGGIAAGENCTHGKVPTSNWLHDAALRDRTLQGRVVLADTPTFEINLDLPDTERWNEVGAAYRNRTNLLIGYLKQFIPGWALPIVTGIADRLEEYRGFEPYQGEMRGLAKALNVPVGDVVVVNLIYTVEQLGINCSNWNNTGPTGECTNGADGYMWFDTPRDSDGPWGYCTSVVAEDAKGKIYHGRNLDWNLDPVLRQFVINQKYTKGGKTIAIGTGLVGYMGNLNGIKPGQFSFSTNARCQGGKILDNLVEAIRFGAMTPGMHARLALTEAVDFKDAVEKYSTGPMIDEVYYTLAGISTGQGVVISRDRNNDDKHLPDQWFIDPKNASAWYRLQTNYDHWLPVPAADDRRHPGFAAMDKMGQSNLSLKNLYNVMMTWPVFNHHTDYTAMAIPLDGTYETFVWMNNTVSRL